MSAGEFSLIETFFSHIGESSAIELGIGDDAATVRVPDGHALQISTDTAIEGVHFPPDFAPADIAYRSVMAAASDLAAMGASPIGMLLAITLPTADSAWLACFANGLRAASDASRLPLIGGDTTRGGLSLTLTVLGATPSSRGLRRDGARAGDRLCVSGTLGDAAAGLAVIQGKLQPTEQAAAQFLQARFARPTARLALGESLRGVATAAIDVSDGLLADTAHIAHASAVAIEIDSGKIPLSRALKGMPDTVQVRQWALTGGDDYELLVTLPPEGPVPETLTEIGRVVAGRGVRCDQAPTGGGYDHFA
jgi:thiamine-monophosphate kinase